jgi:hypothetical protein
LRCSFSSILRVLNSSQHSLYGNYIEKLCRSQIILIYYDSLISFSQVLKQNLNKIQNLNVRLLAPPLHSYLCCMIVIMFALNSTCLNASKYRTSCVTMTTNVIRFILQVYPDFQLPWFGTYIPYAECREITDGFTLSWWDIKNWLHAYNLNTALTQISCQTKSGSLPITRLLLVRHSSKLDKLTIKIGRRVLTRTPDKSRIWILSLI